MPETEYMKTKYIFPIVNHNVTPGNNWADRAAAASWVGGGSSSLPPGPSLVLPTQKLESAISNL